jgi:putative PIG3 family NAD(P)H quinone oxidoreductase
LIDVHATALNRADLLQRRGLYPPPEGVTDILGLECSGVVAELGPGAGQFLEGERVMALLPGGGYAERVAVHERHVLRVPENLSFEQAAAVPEAFLTADEALFEAGELAPGQSVLIHAAAGGVGTAAVQLARARGARVFATSSAPEKLSFLADLGADFPINYKEQRFDEIVLQHTGGRGVDVILDFVGAAYAEAHARCLAEAGSLVVLGLLGGARASIDLGRLLRARHRITGVVMRSRSIDDKAAIVARFARNWLPLFPDRIKPIVDSVLSLSEAERAHERMAHNQNVGKIVLRVHS